MSRVVRCVFRGVRYKIPLFFMLLIGQRATGNFTCCWLCSEFYQVPFVNLEVHKRQLACCTFPIVEHISSLEYNHKKRESKSHKIHDFYYTVYDGIFQFSLYSVFKWSAIGPTTPAFSTLWRWTFTFALLNWRLLTAWLHGACYGPWLHYRDATPGWFRSIYPWKIPTGPDFRVMASISWINSEFSSSFWKWRLSCYSDALFFYSAGLGSSGTSSVPAWSLSKGWWQSIVSHPLRFSVSICQTRSPICRRAEFDTSERIRCEWKDCVYPGTFTNEGTLVRHLRTVHFSPNRFKCDICGKRFGRKDRYRTHRQMAHSQAHARD